MLLLKLSDYFIFIGTSIQLNMHYSKRLQIIILTIMKVQISRESSFLAKWETNRFKKYPEPYSYVVKRLLRSFTG